MLLPYANPAINNIVYIQISRPWSAWFDANSDHILESQVMLVDDQVVFAPFSSMDCLKVKKRFLTRRKPKFK